MKHAIIGFVLISFLLWVAGSFARVLFVERQCLQAGYPKAAIDYTWQGYCFSVDGAVRVNVTELP